MNRHEAMARTAKRFLKPRLVDPTINYYVMEKDNNAFEVWSKVDTNFGGPAHNYVATVTSQQLADDLIDRLKRL